MVQKNVYDFIATKGPLVSQRDFYNKLAVGLMAGTIVTTVFIGAAKQNTHRVVYESPYVVSNSKPILQDLKPSSLEVAVLEPLYKRQK